MTKAPQQRTPIIPQPCARHQSEAKKHPFGDLLLKALDEVARQHRPGAA